MAKTNKGLVEFAKKMLGHPYWYGTYGNTSTRSLYTSKKKQYPAMYHWELTKNQLGTKVCDCVGLIKAYLWCKDFESNPVYNKKQDVSANGMLAVCKKHGSIKSMPDVAGTLVFKQGHVGVYIGNGLVIEARGHAYGVVKTTLKSRGWQNWGWCPWIEYIVDEAPKPSPAKPTPKPAPTPTKKTYGGNFPKLVLGRALKFGSSGNNVKRLQKFLNWYGNYKLDVDGAYGRKTESAVRDFQAKNGLAVDGKFGKKSLAKAMGIRK